MDTNRPPYVDDAALAVRDRIAAAFKECGDDFDPANMAERLGLAFNWSRSPQGFEFWFSITQALYALAKRRSMAEAEKRDR